MAPKRRTAARKATTGPTRQQSTLSFNGKSNQITKSGVTRQSKKDPSAVEDVVRADVKADVTSELEEPTTADKAIELQVEQETDALEAATQADPLEDTEAHTKAEDVLGGRAVTDTVGATGGPLGAGWVGDEELRARKITDSQIKRYWREKEAKRLAPRVHQEDLSVYEKALREWDMSGQYGPCIGIARLKRWKRANMLGLSPPIEILAILLKEMDSGDSNVQRAHVDELLSSRFIET